ncbi:hypothetical protein ACQEVX_22915 [Streptomyces syringium]|uniref:hypothetical protein n=1 Tax=Streptomyces syringium TaxID=76729 RepID=UPI003D93B290
MTDVAARNRRNKQAGARWEAELRDELRNAGFDVERLRLTGRDDEGDLVVRLFDGRFLVIEAKNARFEPGVFVGEAEAERENFAQHRDLDPAAVDSVVIVRRRGANWRRAYVLTTVERYFDLAPA